MTAENPTSSDLRVLAANLKAEGQNSRAEVITNTALKLQATEQWTEFCRKMQAIDRLIERAEAVTLWLTRDIDQSIMPVVRIARSDVEALAQALEEVKK